DIQRVLHGLEGRVREERERARDRLAVARRHSDLGRLEVSGCGAPDDLALFGSAQRLVLADDNEEGRDRACRDQRHEQSLTLCPPCYSSLAVSSSHRRSPRSEPPMLLPIPPLQVVL